MTENAKATEANEEQLLYASILEKGMYTGLVLLLVTFVLYLTGIMEPAIPIEQLPNYWVMSVHDYSEAINHNFLHREHVITGWGWLAVVGKGDFVNFLGIALLSGVTIVCYIGILPTLLRTKQKAYFWIAITEVVILALAASGILTAGH